MESRGSAVITYTVDEHSNALKNITHRNRYGHATSSTGNRLLLAFYEAFLPVGYPDSVAPDYLEYQVWDTIQALCSSVTGTLSTRSILQGVGVGSAEATLLGGTLSWTLRDGISMISRISFASKLALDLDNDAKRWRYIADITNDIALTIEIFSSWLPTPTLFLLSVSLASVFKAITGVAGGGARASLTHHFAQRDNTADLAAKEGSQETAAGLFGMLLGMAVAWLVPGDDCWATLIVVAFFTAAHLYSNYRAVSSLVLHYLNLQRAGIVMSAFARTGRVPSPAVVARSEGILRYHAEASAILPRDLKLGASWSEFVSNHRRLVAASLHELSSEVFASIAAHGYALLVCYGKGRDTNDVSHRVIYGSSHPSAEVVLASLFHATTESRSEQQKFADASVVYCASNASVANAKKQYAIFAREAERAGWNLQRAQVGLEGWCMQSFCGA